ncbi:MAG: hypothetical protein IJ071_08215 [Ruminococcus sp.]|nr:hypothetical protein [Ruminococcus sp.]
MKIYAKGKTIPTYQFSRLFVQGERFADLIVFVLDRYYSGSDLMECDMMIRGVTEEGWEAQQGLTKELSGDKILVAWRVSDLFTLNAGRLALELRASRMNGDVSELIIKYAMEPVNVLPAASGKNGALPDTAEQAVSAISAAIDGALITMEQAAERYDLEHTGQRLDQIEADTAVYLARPEVIPMTRQEYAGSVHKANSLYVIIDEEVVQS